MIPSLKSKKSIVFANSNLAWGGGEKWHYQMACALATKGYNVHLIVQPESELSKKVFPKEITLHYIKITKLSFLNIFKRAEIRKLLSNLAPKAIFLNLPADAKAFAPIAKNLGVNKVIYRRGMPHPLKRSLVNKYVFSNIDLFIANSNEIKKSIIKNFPENKEKTIIVYNGVEEKSHILPKIENKLIIGNLGRLVEQKGQKHLIEVAKILKKQEFNFKLLIAGTGPLKEQLEIEIKKNSLEDFVELTGHVNPDNFLSKIQLFVFTSYFEGSANALIEANQYGIPSIAFDISSNPEVVINEKNGFLIKPFDEKAMASKIIELGENHELYQKMHKNAKMIVNEKFLYSDKIKEIEKILNE